MLSPITKKEKGRGEKEEKGINFKKRNLGGGTGTVVRGKVKNGDSG